MNVVIPLTLDVVGAMPAGMAVLDAGSFHLKWVLVGLVGLALVAFVWRKRDSFIYHQT